MQRLRAYFVLASSNFAQSNALMPRPPSSIAALSHSLGKSDRPVYVLDAQRRIVYCNAACADWVGQTVESLLGKRCDFHSQPAAADAVAACELCPPPEAFLGQHASFVLSRTGPDGQLLQRRGDFWPLDESQTASAALLAILAFHDEPTATAVHHSELPGSAADRDLHDALRQFRSAAAGRFAFDRLVGVSPASAKARAQADLAARAATSVLLCGPAGSGKRHLSKAIHYRRFGGAEVNLLTIDCAALSADQLISNVAMWLSRGQALLSKTATAGGSAAAHQPDTLLLVHVDRLPGEAQFEVARLLRLTPAKSLVLATAEKALAPLVAEGAFRADLAAWLSTLEIELPPLSARAEDVPLLAQVFLEACNAEGGRQLSGIAAEALDRLTAYSWPGNLDELADVIRQVHERAAGAQIVLRDLPKQLHLAADAAERPRRSEEPIELEAFLQGVERELIDRALARSKGNKSKAARLLGLTRPRLYRRMVQLGYESEMFKPE